MADQWYTPQALGDSGFASGPTSTGWAPQSFCYGAAISIGAPGTATKLAVRTEASTTPTVKIGLYDSTPTLLVQSTLTNGTGAAWREAVISNTAVTAGTYYVLVSSSDTNSLYYYNTGFNGSAATVAYASAMPASPTLTVETNLLYGVKIWVQDLAATLEQEGYRWRNDDGNETTATWKAAQDTTITGATATNTRLRLIVNAANDPASQVFKVQYRKVGAASWRNADKFV